MALDNNHMQAAHLLRRAGFGGSQALIDEYANLDFNAAVDRLLNYSNVDNSAMDSKVTALGINNPADPKGIRAVWLARMLYTARPLEEKMTLFWHNHFATAISKVNDAVAMQRQNDLFRSHALDKFDVMLKQVARDPAMLIWLDSNTNRKGHPNENWARELMELFTMGIGNYTENDVKEEARAWTGWFERQGAFYFARNQHDFGQKTFLGQTGNFNGDDIIDILAKQPATGNYMASKLIKWFVTDTPDPQMVKRISDIYFSSGYSIRAMVEAILKSDEFKASYRAQIKSPADFTVGMLRALEVQKIDPNIAYVPAAMNMDLYNPPSVKGWDWGTAWISTNTYFARANTADKLILQANKNQPYYIDALGLLQRAGVHDADGAVNFYLDLLCDGDVSDGTRNDLRSYLGSVDLSKDNTDSETKVRGLIHLVLASPAYQMN